MRIHQSILGLLLVVTVTMFGATANAQQNIVLGCATITGGSVISTNSQGSLRAAITPISGVSTNGTMILKAGAEFQCTPTLANSVGQTADASSSLKFFPNPVQETGELTLSLASSTQLEVSLFDMSGHWVKTFFDGAQPAGTITIGVDLKGIASGAYLIAVRMPGSLMQTRINVIH